MTPEEKLRIIKEEADRFYEPFYELVHKCPHVLLYDDAIWLILCGWLPGNVTFEECKKCPVFKQLGITIPTWPPEGGKSP